MLPKTLLLGLAAVALAAPIPNAEERGITKDKTDIVRRDAEADPGSVSLADILKSLHAPQIGNGDIGAYIYETTAENPENPGGSPEGEDEPIPAGESPEGPDGPPKGDYEPPRAGEPPTVPENPENTDGTKPPPEGKTEGTDDSAMVESSDGPEAESPDGPETERPDGPAAVTPDQTEGEPY
jgi:hypothetical protein